MSTHSTYDSSFHWKNAFNACFLALRSASWTDTTGSWDFSVLDDRLLCRSFVLPPPRALVLEFAPAARPNSKSHSLTNCFMTNVEFSEDPSEFCPVWIIKREPTRAARSGSPQ